MKIENYFIKLSKLLSAKIYIEYDDNHISEVFFLEEDRKKLNIDILIKGTESHTIPIKHIQAAEIIRVEFYLYNNNTYKMLEYSFSVKNKEIFNISIQPNLGNIFSLNKQKV